MRRLSRVVPLLAAVAVAGGVFVPVSAGVPVLYTVAEDLEVVEIELHGARGGSAEGNGFVSQGGAGCRVTASLPVAAEDVKTWNPGLAGGSTDRVAEVRPGGVGGAGARPGGDGGPMNSLSGTTPGTAGAGGGGASSLSLNGEELIVAAGGGGGAAQSGGAACASNTAAGGQGFGTTPTAGGGLSPDSGGAAGLGNGGSASPPPGTAGNSATGTPPGKGGTGGAGTFSAPGGGGGGGGISGGGGGAGQTGVFSGGNGSGAAGLSGAPQPSSGIAAPRFAPSDRSEASVEVRAVVVSTSSLPPATAGTSYSVTLDAEFIQVAANGIVVPFGAPQAARVAEADDTVWSLAPDSDPLPDGLSLTDAGVLAGTPTSAADAELVFVAEVQDAQGDARARSVVTLSLDVSGSAPTSSTSSTSSTTEPAPTTTAQDPAVPTTNTAGAGRGGTLPSTGASGVAPLVAAGALLVGSGAGAALLSRRRRT